MPVEHELTSLAPIEYWTEELTPPLYGITDIKQPPCRDNFLCVYNNNTATLYFINGRHEEEAEIGYNYFNQEDSVEKYAEEVHRVLEQQKTLQGTDPSLDTIIEVSREFNRVYDMTEEARLKKFENVDSEEIWNRFKKIAELRLLMRKELESTLYVQSSSVLEKLAHSHGMHKNDLFFYTYEELQQLLTNSTKIPPDVVAERQAGYIYWIKDGKSFLYTGKRYEAFAEALDRIHNTKNIQELKGRSASRGVVQGTVQLLLNNTKDLDEQIAQFKDGMILVTEMTRPRILMACYRAKAIITDEGGIVSHASITARELKIPCVIGTKIATKVLKNGDVVEVDGDRGVVRILS